MNERNALSIGTHIIELRIQRPLNSRVQQYKARLRGKPIFPIDRIPQAIVGIEEKSSFANPASDLTE
jgi:hypothetical protein